jgi:hypothetical protein
MSGRDYWQRNCGNLLRLGCVKSPKFSELRPTNVFKTEDRVGLAGTENAQGESVFVAIGLLAPTPEP